MAEDDSRHSKRRSLSGEEVDAGWDEEEPISLPDEDAVSVREDGDAEGPAISLREEDLLDLAPSTRNVGLPLEPFDLAPSTRNRDSLIEPEPSTKTVDSLEMRRLAARRSGSHPPPPPASARGGGSSTPPPRPELLATMPPPVPASEYVAQMMGGHDDDAPESGMRTPPRYPKLPSIAERHRAILETLYEEDPLRFDFDDVTTRPVSALPPPISVAAPNSAPMIESEEASADDLDPELLKDTPVPDVPPGGGEVDELDELPVDLLLAGLTLPAHKASVPGIFARRGESQVPTMQEFPPLPGAEGAPVAASAGGSVRREASSGGSVRPPEVHDRATLPGFDPEDPIELLHDRFVGGDYEGALTLAEGILEVEPDNAEAKRYADSCRDLLRQTFLSRVGGGTQVPRVVMSADQLHSLALDHRSGFLLSCVDGMSSVDEILDVCGMPGSDAIRILADLFDKGVVDVGAR